MNKKMHFRVKYAKICTKKVLLKLKKLSWSIEIISERYLVKKKVKYAIICKNMHQKSSVKIEEIILKYWNKFHRCLVKNKLVK